MNSKHVLAHAAIAGSLFLLGCGVSRSPETASRIRELCAALQTTRDAEKSWWDVTPYSAAIALGEIGLRQPLPAEAMDALRRTAADDSEWRAQVDPVDGVVEITGLDKRLRVGDGARIALCMLELAQTPSDLERMRLLWALYTNPYSGQALRSFCMARLIDFESESVVPFLAAAAADDAGISRLDRRWCVLRLTEFYPISANLLLALTRSEDDAVACIALGGIDRLGMPRDWEGNADRTRADGVIALPAISRPRQLDAVRLLCVEEYDPPAAGRQVGLERVARDLLTRLGVRVVGAAETGSNTVSLRIRARATCLGEGGPPGPDEVHSKEGMWGARIDGQIVALLEGTEHTVPFAGELWRQPHFPGKPAIVPYDDVLLRSDFAANLAGVVSALSGKDYVEVLALLSRDTDWRIGLSAAWAMRRIRSPSLVGPLAVVLEHDPVWLARVAAASALGHIADTEAGRVAAQQAIEPLARSVGLSVEWPERYGVICALGLARARQATESLLQFPVCDEYWLVRQAAAWALGRIGDPRAVDKLRDLAQRDADPRVRSEAAKALTLITGK